MNYLLVGEFGQVNDNIQHMIEKICPYTDISKYRRIIENGKQGILICSPDIKDELDSHLTEGYEYWFDIITKPISEEELRKILT